MKIFFNTLKKIFLKELIITKNKKKEGYGEMIYKNGDKYIGNWKDDKREGEGKLIIRNEGEEYEGIWKEDEILTCKMMINSYNKDRYKGEIVNNQYNGKGKLIYENGNIYEE